jgi:4-amino-4-deoxy-L-arabinose transferase-like glycosyltransferase
LSCLTCVLALGRPAITDSDEAFYAEAAREMVESGDWLTPNFNYIDRWEKPVLYYWLTAALYLVAGAEAWAARAWAALSGIGLVLLTWVAGKRLTSDEDTAWLAGAIVATSYGCFAMARSALPDLPLAFTVSAVIWLAFRASQSRGSRVRLRWWLGAGLAAGLGFLIKGPVALVVPAVVLLPAWWQAREQVRLSFTEVAVAGATCVAVAAPWYIAMTMEHGVAYLESFFLSDNIARFTTDQFNEPRPLWFYLPVLLGGFMPWTGYMLTAPVFNFTEIARGRRTLTDHEWLLVLWVAMPLIFFTLSVGKQPRYILPVLPPLAILLARSVLRRAHEAVAGSSSANRRLLMATWATAGLYVLLAFLLMRIQIILPDMSHIVSWIAVTGLLIGATGLAITAIYRKWRYLHLVMTGAATLLMLATLYGFLSTGRPSPVERIASMVVTERSADEPVAVYGAFVRNLVFYTGIPQVPLYNEEQAITFLRSEERILMAVRERDLQRLERLAGVSVQIIGKTSYLNTSAIRLEALLWPLPAQDLATVLLVTNR